LVLALLLFLVLLLLLLLLFLGMQMEQLGKNIINKYTKPGQKYEHEYEWQYKGPQ